MNPLFDLANRQQVYLERLKAGFAGSWDSQQGRLREEIRLTLAALEVPDMQDLNRVQLEKLLIGLRQAHLKVSRPVIAAFFQQLPELAEYAAGAELAGLVGAIANAPRFNAPTANAAFQRALKEPLQATGQILSEFIRTWPEADALRVSNLVRRGWAQGKTVAQMVRDAIGTRANKYEDGFLEVSRHHARTVINTATQHVASAARLDLWERNADIVEKYQWVSTLDRKTSQQCKSLDGQIFEPGKGPLPPIHPNCRSTTIGVLNPKFDFLKAGRTRSSELGYVPGDQSFYSWLKTQDQTFQETALGKTRARLFRDGGLTEERFRALNIGRDFEPLSLVDMKRIEPQAFARAGL